MVKTQFEGMHRWANCPIDAVSFLKNDHRHLFYVNLTLPVSHDDRDLEFFVVKSALNKSIKGLYHKDHVGIQHLGSCSCEMIAKEIIEDLLLLDTFKNLAWIRCTVSEDDENSAGVMWEKIEGPLI
jgi:hypothetical protein